MHPPIQLTVLVENCIRLQGLRAEHGWCVHVRAGKESLLFDTGQSDLLLHNARLLGIDLGSLQHVVLSHGHFDHTGGLTSLMGVVPEALCHLHPAALEPKFKRENDGSSRAIGIPEQSRRALPSAAGKLIQARDVQEILPGLFTTGEIPRRTSFEDVGGPFFLDARCRQPDPIVDDQALFVRTENGLVVLLGCAHAGVVNTLHHIREVTGEKRIHTVLGGMHLQSASAERMTATIRCLREFNVQRLLPGHCTGWPAVAELWKAFPASCEPCPVGTRLSY